MNDEGLTRLRTMHSLRLIFAILLALTIVAETLVPTHARFGVDGSFGFHAWLGGVACAGLIAVAKFLGIFLKRKDDYYGD